jgi:hypothetical protein
VDPVLRKGQLVLPLRLGGMGIRLTTESEARAAYLSAAAMTETAMRTGAPQFQPFAGPGGPSLEGDYRALYPTSTEARDAPAEAPPLDTKVIDEDLPGYQRLHARHVAQARQADLLASFNSDGEEGPGNLARLLSCACRPASLWLDVLPTSTALQLSDADFKSAMRLRLGVSQMPANAPGLQCTCGRRIQVRDKDHAMSCKALSGAMTLRHEILKGTWRRIANRAGIASSAEPAMRSLPGVQASAVANSPESRGDILMVLPDGLTVTDVSVIHPAAASYVRAARVEGGAAASRDQVKRAQYSSADPNGYAFVPLSVETFGRLGKPAMELLNQLATTAASGGTARKDCFVIGALKELSVALCRGNGFVLRRSLGVLARVAGTSFLMGMTVPTSEIP